MSIKYRLKPQHGIFMFPRRISNILFGEDAQLHYIKELSQPGQYLCQERLTVKGLKVSIRIWPF